MLEVECSWQDIILFYKMFMFELRKRKCFVISDERIKINICRYTQIQIILFEFNLFNRNKYIYLCIFITLVRNELVANSGDEVLMKIFRYFFNEIRDISHLAAFEEHLTYS